MPRSFADMAPHPVIELDALLRDYQLGLVLIAGGSPTVGRSPVQWVHASDLRDPTPFLTPRTVLLTTGTQFVDDDALIAPRESDATGAEPLDIDAYVLRLAEAGTTALGIAVGIQWERIPPQLISACDRHGLPLFRVPYDTPFIAVVRTAARLLDVQQHAAEPGLSGRRTQWDGARAALRTAVFRLLSAGQRDLAEQVAAPILPTLPRGSVTVVQYRDADAGSAAGELARIVQDQPGALASTESGITRAIVEAPRLTELRRVLARASITAGISERGSAEEIPELSEQAARAHELALRRAAPVQLSYRPAMHAGVLTVLRDSPEALRRAAGLLAPVREHDRRHADTIEASLRCWLAHHGQMSPAAAELGVHRHTLRNRVQTAGALLQRDLDSPDARAELWAAFRLLGDAPALRSPEGAR